MWRWVSSTATLREAVAPPRSAQVLSQVSTTARAGVWPTSARRKRVLMPVSGCGIRDPIATRTRAPRLHALPPLMVTICRQSTAARLRSVPTPHLVLSTFRTAAPETIVVCPTARRPRLGDISPGSITSAVPIVQRLRAHVPPRVFTYPNLTNAANPSARTLRLANTTRLTATRRTPVRLPRAPTRPGGSATLVPTVTQASVLWRLVLLRRLVTTLERREAAVKVCAARL